MKNKLGRRLTLHRDTIRELTAEELRFVGGGTGEGEGTICSPNGCVELQEKTGESEPCGGGGGRDTDWLGCGGGGGGTGTGGTGALTTDDSQVYVNTLCQLC